MDRHEVSSAGNPAADRARFGQSSSMRISLAAAGLQRPPRPITGYKPISTLNKSEPGMQASASFASLLEPLPPNSLDWKIQRVKARLESKSGGKSSTRGGDDLIMTENRKTHDAGQPIQLKPALTTTRFRSDPFAKFQQYIDPKNDSATTNRPSDATVISKPGFRACQYSPPVRSTTDYDIPVKYDFRDYDYIPAADVAGSLNDIINGISQTSEQKEVISDKDSAVEGLKIKLMKHQIEGLKFLLSREDTNVKNKGGLLCDDMGLGKTIQSIALILSHPLDRSTHSSTNACKGTLIVAPLALINQWATEIKTKAPVLSVLIYHGASRTKSESNLKTYDVVITTYQLVASENLSNGLLFKLDWWRIILDEAHTIKNKSSQSAQGACALSGLNRWALTGTPLQNSIDELHSLFNYLRIPPLSDFAFWKSKISQPAASGRGKLAMKRLQIVLAQIMLRRTKDVLSENGMNLPKRNIYKSVVVLTEAERVFYNSLETKMASKMEDMLGNGGRTYMSVLLLLLRMRQACNHTAIVASKLLDNTEAVIPVVEQKRSKKVSTKFSDDIDALADFLGSMTVDIKSCTICQTELTLEQSKAGTQYCEYCLSLFVTKGVSASVPSSKITRLLDLLEVEPSRKTIVFSQFTTMLDIIEPFLKARHIEFVRYDGSMRSQHRVESLENLSNNQNVTVLLCSLKCGALGLNLTCASRVILIDPWWNPMISEQAIDRVHRIGQTRDVDVYEITAEETVEERILKLQDQKRELAKGVMDNKDGKLNFNRLTKDEILFLFNRHDTDAT
ncbi:SNF2 family N-terminal domain-containing protein [Lipomyces arxii]|uniref:SNF2 family N-terminal domain-containing protein n=1 Tax=Lipomyces arxii TaxID=56418 RepID=UPI0034CEF8D8